MMIVLTRDDIALLSSQCQAELQRLVFERPSEITLPTEEPFLFEGSPDDYSASEGDERVSFEKVGKRVVSISERDAKALVANISDKSLHTLRLFASGDPISLDQLIGSDCPYENLTDLKRSFVGAVTRRLRTVTRNKSATLFLHKTLVDGSTAIGVRPASAEALRIALNQSTEKEA